MSCDNSRNQAKRFVTGQQLQEVAGRADDVPFAFIQRALGEHEDLVQAEQLVAKGRQRMVGHAPAD